VGAPAAPPPDALEENARPTGGRAAAQSARRSEGEAAELRDGVALIAALCACWQAQSLFA
jgi:hypothetical protein